MDIKDISNGLDTPDNIGHSTMQVRTKKNTITSRNTSIVWYLPYRGTVATLFVSKHLITSS